VLPPIRLPAEVLFRERSALPQDCVRRVFFEEPVSALAALRPGMGSS